MKKFSVTELRKTIKAAGRLKRELLFRPQGPKLDKTSKAAEAMLSSWMRNSGLDLDRLQVLQKQRDAELLRHADQHKKQALRLAARRKNKSAIALQGKAWASLASGGTIFPNPSFTLDTPFLIWSTPLIAVESSAAPFNSWAKFRFLTSKYCGTQKVSFYFYWVNSFSDYAVISATTYLSADGYLRAHAPWAYGPNKSFLHTFGWLGLSLGVSTDLNSADYTTAYFGGAAALNSPTSGDVDSKTIDTGASLSKMMFAVPPGNVAVIEVALAVEYENDSGNIEADFETGSFLVFCPVVVVSLLNSPPGPLTAAERRIKMRPS